MNAKILELGKFVKILTKGLKSFIGNGIFAKDNTFKIWQFLSILNENSNFIILDLIIVKKDSFNVGHRVSLIKDVDIFWFEGWELTVKFDNIFWLLDWQRTI